MAELIPKAKSFPPGWWSLPTSPGGKGFAVPTLCCSGGSSLGVSSSLSRPGLNSPPSPASPTECCLTHFPCPLGPSILAASAQGPALAEKLISHQTPLLEIVIRAGLLELSDLFLPLPNLSL